MRLRTDRITMTKLMGSPRIYCNINVNDRILLGDFITFNYQTLVIKRPNIDSKKVHSIKTGQFTFVTKEGNYEDFVGVYKLVQIDEDTFKLKKRKTKIK